MPDGQSLPPLIEGGVVWRIVRRNAGWTLWRRIYLRTHASALPLALRGPFLGGDEN
jgi:hypothetical protein